MGRRGMSAQERREYEKLQERKKQRLERQQARTMGSNPAKSTPGSSNRTAESRKVRRPDPDKRRRPEAELERRYDRDGMNQEDVKRIQPKGRRKRRPERSKRNILGNILLILQLIVSVAFVGILALSNIIPLKFMVLIGVFLIILLLIGVVSQIKRRKRAVSYTHLVQHIRQHIIGGRYIYMGKLIRWIVFLTKNFNYGVNIIIGMDCDICL